MYWNGKEIATFDIETTSLSSPDGEFICSVFYDDNEYRVSENILELGELFFYLSKDKTLLVTFNGENYHGGFDFPWLRTKFNENILDWTLSGFPHLDIYPLIEKYFNFDFEEIKTISKSRLKADDVKKIAKENDIEYTNKKETYKKLKEKDDTDWLEYTEEKVKGHYDLQTIYQTLFDPNCEEEYVSGADSVNMSKEENIEHCKRDVLRTYKVTNMVLDYIPSWEIERNIRSL